MFGNNWIFQQDGATANTGNLTQKWCCENFPVFIDKNWWPPNSPDLNPLDYSIWNELVQNMNREKVESKKSLISEIKRSVQKINKEIVFESYNSWTKRLYRMKKKWWKLFILTITVV